MLGSDKNSTANKCSGQLQNMFHLIFCYEISLYKITHCGKFYFPKMAVTISPIPHPSLQYRPATLLPRGRSVFSLLESRWTSDHWQIECIKEVLCVFEVVIKGNAASASSDRILMPGAPSHHVRNPTPLRTLCWKGARSYREATGRCSVQQLQFLSHPYPGIRHMSKQTFRWLQFPSIKSPWSPCFPTCGPRYPRKKQVILSIPSPNSWSTGFENI